MADHPVDLLVRTGFIPVCEQNLCVRTGWCSDGVSGVVFLQWRAWKSKMDEVVFLSVLSGSSDFVRNSACYDLWRHQSDCLAPERREQGAFGKRKETLFPVHIPVFRGRAILYNLEHPDKG